jgi:predicted glycoside hydrolase/deacetylase ChbG (UPF0249 family)
MPRYLIVNADDFGLTRGINRGIIEAAERGILTSASLMVRYPAAAEAASYCRRDPALSLGLHVELGEWIFQHGEWVLSYEVVPADDAQKVKAEIEQQLAEFERLAGRPPDHLDSHQHVHRNEPVRSIMLAMAKRLSVPLRECSREVHFCGDFYGQTGEGEPLPGTLTTEILAKILEKLPEGTSELGCHPGYAEGLESVYRLEREEELRVLCDPALREALKRFDIKLRGFTTSKM